MSLLKKSGKRSLGMNESGSDCLYIDQHRRDAVNVGVQETGIF